MVQFTQVYTGNLTARTPQNSNTFSSSGVVGFTLDSNGAGVIAVRAALQVQEGAQWYNFWNHEKATVTFGEFIPLPDIVRELDATLRIVLYSDVDVTGLTLRFATLDSNTPGDGMADYRLGDLYQTAANRTVLHVQHGKLWLPLRGGTVGNVGSGATFADVRLQDLYIMLHGFPLVFTDGVAKAIAQDDWDSGVRLLVPDATGRIVGGADGNSIMGAIGADAATLGINNLPENIPITLTSNSTGFDTPTPGITTGNLNFVRGGTNTPDKTLAQLITATLQGGGQGFSVVQRSLYCVRTLLMCAGES